MQAHTVQDPIHLQLLPGKCVRLFIKAVRLQASLRGWIRSLSICPSASGPTPPITKQIITFSDFCQSAFSYQKLQAAGSFTLLRCLDRNSIYLYSLKSLIGLQALYNLYDSVIVLVSAETGSFLDYLFLWFGIIYFCAHVNCLHVDFASTNEWP